MATMKRRHIPYSQEKEEYTSLIDGEANKKERHNTYQPEYSSNKV
jgi:hypothetical protein